MTKDVQALGILAGGGILPLQLADHCKSQGIDVFVIGFDGHVNASDFSDHDFQSAKLGQVGKVIKAFKKRNISDLVMIGSITRPSFSELIPDLKALKFLSSTKLNAVGDSDLLSALRRFLEGEGFDIHGIQHFMPHILTPNGCITKAKPSKEDLVDIDRGVVALNSMASLDIGQAIIVQEGLVLGVEAIEGTAKLIARCGDLKRKGSKGVLVKLCKTQQDTDLDLPTIGIKTLRAIHDAGFGGIVLHAGKSLMINQEELVSFANAHHLYIVGIDPDAS